jgi:hypothetical protein
MPSSIIYHKGKDMAIASVNLIREARVFFTTNVDATTGKIDKTTATTTSAKTFEFQVLDGLSFSQNTGTETVSINESGENPTRGQRTFNTSLEPVDFSFSTYMRPAKIGATTSAEERFLWNAFASNKPIGEDPAGDLNDGAWVNGAVAGTNAAVLDFSSSNKNQLQKFGIIVAMGGSTFLIHNCALESVSIDFGIDAIATLSWTGKATEIEQVDAITFESTVTAGVQNFTAGGLGTGSVTTKVTDGKYLANKLSSAEIKYPVSTDPNTKTYILPITGGNLTISNNLTYLTPATVGVVNKPLTYFAGARTYSGSLTCYLRKGGTSPDANDSGALFSSILTSAISSDTNKAEVLVSVGGSSATAKVELSAPTAMLQVPNIATEQVISATFGFVPQGSTGIGSTDELTVKYYHPATA